MEIAKITGCNLYFETSDGDKGTINIPNIYSGDMSVDEYQYLGQSTINISLNTFKTFENNELFNIVIDKDEKESGEENEDMGKFYYTVISCIFPRDKNKYYSDSKVYNYIIDGPPENCSIKKNILFQVFDKQHKVKYGGAELLCTDVTGFKCIQDIQDYYNRVPYTIPIYEVCGQLNVDELESSETSFKHEYESLFINKEEAKNTTIKPDIPSSQFSTGAEAVKAADTWVEETLKPFASQHGFILCDNGIAIGNGIIGTYEETPITSDIPRGKRSEIAYDEAFVAVDKMITDNKENINTLITEEENSMFDNFVKGLEFGAIKTNDIAYTFNGICFRNAEGNYISLNPDGTFTNIYDMTVDIPIYVMPVGKDQIKIGDIIKHFDKWVMVAQIDKTTITALDPWTREIRVIIPEKSIFGFDYYTKVIDIFSGFGNSANQNSPFGNMLPFLMMSKDSDIDPMMFMLMSGQNFGGNMNPMMMYMMMSKNSGTDSKDKIFPLMMMMNSGMFGGNGCNCNGDCKCDGTANSSESAPYMFYYDNGNDEDTGDSQNSED